MGRPTLVQLFSHRLAGSLADGRLLITSPSPDVVIKISYYLFHFVIKN